MKWYLSGVLVVALAGCAGTRNQGPPPEVLDQNLKRAQAIITEADKVRCISAYKDRMHDPSSFQLAGPLEPDRVATGVANDPFYQKAPNTVVFSARVRGRNAMGGLVLNRMQCDYQLVGDRLRLLQVL